MNTSARTIYTVGIKRVWPSGASEYYEHQTIDLDALYNAEIMKTNMTTGMPIKRMSFKVLGVGEPFFGSAWSGRKFFTADERDEYVRGFEAYPACNGVETGQRFTQGWLDAEARDERRQEARRDAMEERRERSEYEHG